METDTQPKPYLRRQEAADYLHQRYGLYTRDTLAKLAVSGDGPPYRLLGRFPVYTRAELDTWAEGRLSRPMRSTADAASNRQHAA